MNAKVEGGIPAGINKGCHCLLVGLGFCRLLVPRIMVAEVVEPGDVTLTASLNKDITIFEWRGFQVPLLGRRLFGAEDAGEPGSGGEAEEAGRIIVFHGVLDPGRLPFYALPARGNPRLVPVDAGSVQPSAEPPPRGSAAFFQPVTAAGEEAVIPLADHIEKFIHQQFFR